MISERLLLSSHPHTEVFLLNLKENVVLDYNFPWFGPIISSNGYKWYLNTLSFGWTQKAYESTYVVHNQTPIHDLWDMGEFKRDVLMLIQNNINLSKNMMAVIYNESLILKMFNANIGNVQGNRSATINYFKKEFNIDISCIKGFKEELDLNSLKQKIEPLTKDQIDAIISISRDAKGTISHKKRLQLTVNELEELADYAQHLAGADPDENPETAEAQEVFPPLDYDYPNLGPIGPGGQVTPVQVIPGQVHYTPVYYTITGNITTTLG